MQDFLVLYAPPLVLIFSIVFGFWFSLKDGPIVKGRK